MRRVDPKPAQVSLREITDQNRADVERLGVTPKQAGYVASNSESLREATDTPNARPWYRAIYAARVPRAVFPLATDDRHALAGPGVWTAGSPRGFYLGYGSRFRGDWFDGEEVMELSLDTRDVS